MRPYCNFCDKHVRPVCPTCPESKPCPEWTGSIKQWQEAILENAKDHGWHAPDEDPDTHLSVYLENLHEELSEAWTCYRKFEMDLRFDGDKPEGFPAELADVAIRVFETAELFGIDLEEMIRIKHGYNITRPFKHGGKRF